MKSLVAALLMLAGSLSFGGEAAEPALGPSAAPVTIIEYGSLTCDHCLRFHRHVLPELRRRFIDTGQVRFVFRDFPTSGVAIRGAVGARCVPEGAYHRTLDSLFSSVGRWSLARDVDAALSAEVKALGLDSVAFRACFRDLKAETRVREQRRDAATRLGVSGTPTFLVNGRLIPGAMSLREFERVIAEAKSSIRANR